MQTPKQSDQNALRTEDGSAEVAQPVETAQDFAAKMAHAFIDLCVLDGDESAATVSQKMAAIQGSLNRARYEMERIARVGESAKTNRTIAQSIAESMQQLSDAMVALQSFDRIVQRLNHASRILDATQNNPLYRSAEGDVATLRRERLRLYNMLSMEEERAAFRALEDGKGVPEAVREAVSRLKQTLDNIDDNIDFF